MSYNVPRMTYSKSARPVKLKRRRPTTTVQLTDAARQALETAITIRTSLGFARHGLQTDLINEAIISFGQGKESRL